MKATQAIAILAREVQELRSRVEALEQADPDVDVSGLGLLAPRSDGGGTARSVGAAGSGGEVSRESQSDGPDADAPERQQSRVRTVQEGRGRETVEIPPATPEQKRLRTRVLPALALENLPAEHGVTKQVANAAYVQGGPMWLYLFDRDYVMGLSPEVRKAMFEDVLLTNPDEAHELASDILKDEDPGDPETAIERDKQWRQAHGGRAVPT